MRNSHTGYTLHGEMFGSADTVDVTGEENEKSNFVTQVLDLSR